MTYIPDFSQPDPGWEALPWPSVPLPSEGAPADGGHHELRVIAIGVPDAVTNHIHAMHHYGYAEPGDWSRPIPMLATRIQVDDPKEIMRVLTKRIPRR
ncbi:MAG: hypothetical protein ACFB4J_19060 [Elainellaceae cyanobacterium]